MDQDASTVTRNQSWLTLKYNTSHVHRINYLHTQTKQEVMLLTKKTGLETRRRLQPIAETPEWTLGALVSELFWKYATKSLEACVNVNCTLVTTNNALVPLV